MRCCKKILVICFVVVAIQFSFSQERTLGTWKMFLPYGNSLGLCNAGDKVFNACNKSLFSYEIATGTIQIYDKANGLSDVGIKTINYDLSSNVLAVAYTNSNIDLIYNGTDVYNIPDIKNKSTSGSISINSFSFYNGNAYVSTDLGISVIDLSRKEISNTYVIGSTGSPTKVFATSTDGTTIYAATDDGVKHALLSSTNLQDFNSWTLYNSAQNLPTKKASFVGALNSKVYAVINGSTCDTLFEFNGTSWSALYFDPQHTIQSLLTVNSNLYFSEWGSSGSSSKNGKVDAAGTVSFLNGSFGAPNGWFESSGFAWTTELYGGLYKNAVGNTERILPDGPGSAAVFDVDAVDGVLNVAPGGTTDSWEYTWNSDGFFVYKNSQWKTTNQYSFAPLASYSDILCTATCKGRNKTYFGSFLSGLIEVDNNTGNINLYDKWNSNGILEGATGDTQRTKISAMVSDRKGNLWIGNAGATKPIKLITSDGTWKQFGLPYAFDLMKKIVVDQNNQLWAPIRRGGEGILVWSYNETIDDQSDDKSRLLHSGIGQGGLPDDLVYSIAEDKDGNMWVGTNAGIAVYYCPGSVLTTNGCDADQIKVERDGYVGYLFGTEQVRAIAVDAANRKWIGTSNGLWLISADGKTELLKFTVDNSPLPNNQITDIAIDEKTGEVFIGTIGGLVSYQGDAIADCSDCDAAFVYPNPVKPDYDGPIAIKGLAENAYVKITDVAGTLIFQGKANGCQMIWNGKGYNGNRAKSGVYLVFSSTDLGKEKRVGKILLMN